jgi:hypothetical protein
MGTGFLAGQLTSQTDASRLGRTEVLEDLQDIGKWLVITIPCCLQVSGLDASILKMSPSGETLQDRATGYEFAPFIGPQTRL